MQCEIVCTMPLSIAFLTISAFSLSAWCWYFPQFPMQSSCLSNIMMFCTSKFIVAMDEDDISSNRVPFVLGKTDSTCSSALGLILLITSYFLYSEIGNYII